MAAIVSADTASPVRDGVRPARPSRPSWIETVAILVVCAVAFVVLTRTDRAAYERAMDRARTALAEQAREDALRAPAERRDVVRVKRITARTESLGERGPIAIPLGGAWSAGTASTVAGIAPRSHRTESAEPALRRIVGPIVAIEAPGRSDAASGSAPGATGSAISEPAATADAAHRTTLGAGDAAAARPAAATATDSAAARPAAAAATDSAAARPAATAATDSAAARPAAASSSVLAVVLAALALAGGAMTLAGAVLLRRGPRVRSA